MTTNKCCQTICSLHLLIRVEKEKRPLGVKSSDLHKLVVAHTGLEPVVSALRGQRVSRLHQCAVVGLEL